MTQRILVVADQFLLGGMETHIAGQVKTLVAQGWQAHLACGSHLAPNLLPAAISSVNKDLPFTSSMTVAELLAATTKLRAIIRQHNISVVHAHPFNCLLPALLAAKLEGVAFVFTLHGPASVLGGQGAIFEYLLLTLIYPEADACFAVSEELAALAAPYSNADIHVLPNAVSLSANGLEDQACESAVHWLLASRLDKDKLPGVLSFIRFAVAAGVSHIDIAGEGEAKTELTQTLTELGLIEHVTWLGFCSDLEQRMAQYCAVAGMGRVVLEAMAVQKPVCLVGYDGVKGIINSANFHAIAYANFSGRGINNIRLTEFKQQLTQLTAVPLSLLTTYSDTKVMADYIQLVSTLSTRPSYLCKRLLGYLSCFNEGAEASLLQSNYLFTLLGKLLSENKKISSRYFYYNDIINKQNLQSWQHEQQQQLTQLSWQHSDLKSHVMGQEENVSQLLSWQTSDIKQLFYEQNNVTETHFNWQKSHVDTLQAQQKAHVEVLLTKQAAHIETLLTQQTSDVFNYLNTQNKLLMDELMTIKNKRTLIERLLRLIKLSGQSCYSAQARYELARVIYWRLPMGVRHRLVTVKQAYVNRRLAAQHNQMAEYATPDVTDNKTLLSAWLEQANMSQKVAIVPCAFEFDELVNQRPINAAKYLAKEGYTVLYVVWQWQPNEGLKKQGEVHPGVWQVPLYEFLSQACAITPRPLPSLFLMTFPAAVFMPVADELRQKSFALVYDIMDEWQAFNALGQAPWFDVGAEQELVNKADVVTCVSPPLRDKFSHLRQDIMVSGNGYTASVNGEENYFLARHNHQQADKLRVGYFGHLTDAWFDWELILSSAVQRPELEFDIIGYGEPDWVIKRISELPNVTLHGKILPSELHRYVQHWAVALIPFKPGTLAQAVDPIKIYEYLFYGLPTVVTGISFLSAYPCTYVADNNVASFASALDLALNDTTDDEVLNKFLAASTWDARFSALLERLHANAGLRTLYE